MKIRYFFLIISFISCVAYSQVGIGTPLPNTSSQLDIVSNNRGVLIPRIALTSSLDSSTIINGNKTSLLVYNTASVSDVIPGFYYWNGSQWLRITTSDDTVHNTDDQQLSIDLQSNVLTLEDGGTVYLSPYLDNTDEQQIDSFVLDPETSMLTLSLEDGGTQSIDLSPYLDNTDDQQLSIDLQTNVLTLEDGGTVDLSPYLDNTDDQQIESFELDAQTGILTLSLENSGTQSVNLSPYLDNTDNQRISIDIQTNVLTLEDGGIVDLTPYLDNTDDQQIERFVLDAQTSMLTLSLEDGGTQSIDLSSYLDNTDDQQLSVDLQTKLLTLEDGGSVDLSPLIDADLRMIGASNHITEDAGVGANGSSVGEGTGNIGIGTTVTNTNLGLTSTVLGSNTSGSHNVAIGGGTLSSNTTGFGNVAVGAVALRDNTTARQNVAIGQGALHRTTTGERNIGIGINAVDTNTTGRHNIGIGDNALTSITTGNNNIGIGLRAGQNLTTGDNNIIIVTGGQSFPDPTGSHQLNIGNLIYGINVDGSRYTVSSGNIGIGEQIPQNRLHITAAADPIRLEGLQTGETTDNIVVADANGVLKSVSPTSLTANAIRTETANYNAVATDGTILVDANNANITISLPTGAPVGAKIIVKKIDTTENVVTVDGSGMTIDGNTSISGNLPFQGWTFQFDGANWFIISRI